nr:anoctamin-6-like [Onthophagus taurus]
MREEVCNSNRKICPSCTDKHCLYTELSDYCSLAETVYYLDNNYTAIFAVLMTLWATLFLELWSREEQVFKYKWNLLKSVPQIHELVDYKIRVANHTKYNKFTKTDEYYTPLMMKSYPILYSIIIVLAGILLLIVTTGLILISEYLITYYTIKYKVSIAVDYLVTVMRVYSCLCTIIIIKTYNPLINKISQVLTDREIHRTKNDYMNAYIIKNYVLNFFNTYLMSFYNSFIKEVMFTNPGDYNIYNKVFGIAADLCSPGVGCYFDLSMSTTFNILKEYILLFFINSFLMTHLITGCKFLYKYIYNKLRFNSSIQALNIPQWEEEYTLKPISSTYFCDAFIDLMMEYGLFVFFSAAVPVLPLLVLLNNIVEIRITARALLRKSRRNIPKPVVGLGAWNNVLRIITRLCYLISGTIICFTSFLINRGVYYVNNEYSMEGFINQSLTAFSVYDFNSEMKQNLLSKFPDVTVCYFNGLKNDFNTTHPYQHGFKYYHLVGIKFIIAVIYVHVVYFLSSIVTFYIPKVPSEIAESIAYDVKAKRTEEMEKLTVGNSG